MGFAARLEGRWNNQHFIALVHLLGKDGKSATFNHLFPYELTGKSLDNQSFS